MHSLIKLKNLSFVILIALNLKSKAQVTDNSNNQINTVIAKQISINQKKESMSGYRIQLYFGGKRDKANEIKQDFNNSFPNIPAYITYQQPNFKVRVGDCKTRMEALGILEQIKANYEVTFIVKDDVKLPAIK